MDLQLSMTGFVTRQINIQGQTLVEIEKRLGYKPGRLSQGAYFYVAEEMPSIDGFEFAGYSQVAGHKTQEIFGDINREPALLNRKESVVKLWSKNGSNRIVKVIPVIRHSSAFSDDEQYPPGTGIQQWKLTKTLRFKLDAFVADYPHGKFIPSEGYNPIKYK